MPARAVVRMRLQASCAGKSIGFTLKAKAVHTNIPGTILFCIVVKCQMQHTECDNYVYTHNIMCTYIQFVQAQTLQFTRAV